jgi:sugar phosphate permease
MSTDEKGSIQQAESIQDANVESEVVSKIPRPEDLAMNQALESGEASEELKQLERKLLWKIDSRLLPILSVMYLLAFLDRGNIGNARLGSLEKDLNLVGNDYYNALSIFYAGYVACQIPSNLMVKRMRPSRWIGITMTLWGVCSASMAATHNAAGLFAARFFLGCFETGIGPSAPLILSFWYRREELSSRLAVYLGSSSFGPFEWRSRSSRLEMAFHY